MVAMLPLTTADIRIVIRLHVFHNPHNGHEYWLMTTRKQSSRVINISL